MQLVLEFIIPKLLKTQRVSSGTPLIIRSSKPYLQPVVYIPMWWPVVVKAEREISHQIYKRQTGHRYTRL